MNKEQKKNWVGFFGENIFFWVPVLFVLFGAVTALLMHNPLTASTIFSISLGVLGLVLLCFAKFRKVKAGDIQSFGTKGLTAKEKTLYGIGYVLVAIGLISQAIVIMKAR